MPAPPDYEWLRAPATHRHVSKTFEDVQLSAGARRRSRHRAFLLPAQSTTSATNRLLRQRDTRAASSTSIATDYGYSYVSTRKLGEDGNYVRVYHYVMPAQQMRGGINGVVGRNEVPQLDGHIWVPIDDEHDQCLQLAIQRYDPAIGDHARAMVEAHEHHPAAARKI